MLWNSYTSYSNAWWIPGSESFAGQFVRDAGGTLVLGDDPRVKGNVNASPFDFEVVYEAGLDADLWLPGTFGVKTLDDLVAQDERYADFAAVQVIRPSTISTPAKTPTAATTISRTESPTRRMCSPT